MKVTGRNGGTDIVKTIKISRIELLGHLYNYADAFPTKTSTLSQNLFVWPKLALEFDDGLMVRRCSRPQMGINRWKVVVTDRGNWRRIIESAFACKKLLAYEEEE
ncbi:hypothetical protein TNCV_1701281 [Trichonephila clavipes]|nr:hypothetical protein TNCV_1701281 [Trichonephila clavipes]